MSLDRCEVVDAPVESGPTSMRGFASRLSYRGLGSGWKIVQGSPYVTWGAPADTSSMTDYLGVKTTQFTMFSGVDYCLASEGLSAEELAKVESSLRAR